MRKNSTLPPGQDKDFVASLQKGLEVLTAFRAVTKRCPTARNAQQPPSYSRPVRVSRVRLSRSE